MYITTIWRYLTLKKIFLTIRNVFYIFLLLALFRSISGNLIEFPTNPVTMFIYRIPPLFSVYQLPIILPILFCINIVFIMFSSKIIKSIKNRKTLKIIYIFSIIIDILMILILFINYKVLIIDRNVYLPVFYTYYYYLTYALFISSFISLINNIVYNLKQCFKP